MYSQTILVSLLAALAQARFGQEQIPIPAIAAVQGGDPGEAATIAGAAVSDLLAAANPCVKLKRGDQILAELGTGADAIAAAKGIVAAEQNVNPFAFTNPAICTDPSLPANPILRGIIPLIDPAFAGSAAINTLSAQTLNNPLNANGKSIADLLTENGFTDFRGIADNGSGPVVNGGGNGGAASTTAAAAPAPVATTVNNVVQPTGSTGGNAGAIDFGLCDPSMDFVAGRPGRKPDESTFLPIDPLTKQGQQEALNPNIITNRICDQLTNVCQSNQAAKDRCRSCQSQIQALGTRDQTTADAWNSCVNDGVQVGGGAVPAAASTTANAVAGASSACTVIQVVATTTIMMGAGGAAATPAATPTANANTGTNVQTFTGSVGAPPVPVENVGGPRPFVVRGDSFVNFGAACQRSCDVQKNQCANAANGGNKTVKVSDCETQQQACSGTCQSGTARREKRFIKVYRKRA
ncbi:hypothetical protein H072_8163 [Dactylellina haptotyla CBS 200.50]|uniref:LysM domain-containing protein n=1 Tax=Dactylellina haptotyla (strain CBS 200.50) TaxID=1284197 RepID=S8BFS7_DACHA|nr:hypothetical protein H072_8163 [Dactylellina haptotyla CBS 200.50]